MTKTVQKIAEGLDKLTETSGRDHIAVFGKDGDVSVVERKVVLTEPFLFLFGENIGRVLRHHRLGASSYHVLFEIVALVSHGTATTVLSQLGVAATLGMSKQQVHRAWKELREIGILLTDRAGHEYLNVNLFYRGSPKDLIGRIGKDRFEQSNKALEKLGVRPVVRRSSTRQIVGTGV